MFIENPEMWALSQGYTIVPIQDTNFAVHLGQKAIGALVKTSEGYKFVTECSSSAPDADYEENTSESFVSRSFGLTAFTPFAGAEFGKDSKELVLGPNVSGTGSTERVAECNYWLPYAAEHYKTSRDIRDYILVPIPAIFSDLPNTNGDSLSLRQMLRFDPQLGMQMYKTFRGKGTFLEHCFPGNTPILTRNGYKRIDKIEVGDSVRTHTGAYRKVTHLFNSGVKNVSRLTVQGMGGPILSTKGHPFWVVDRRQVFGKKLKTGKRAPRLKKDDYSDITPHFREVSDIYTGDYLVTPISIGGNLEVDPDFAFLTGVYAAEGSFNKARTGPNKGARTSTVLTLGHHENALLEEVTACLDNLGLEYSVYPRQKTGIVSVWIHGSDFADRMYRLVGEYSHKKHCRGELRSWNNEALKHFLGGYVSGDGHVGRGNRRVRCVTVSKQLAYDIQNVFARLGIPASITGNENSGDLTHTNGKRYKRRKSYHIGASASYASSLNDYIVGKDAVEVFGGKGGRSKAFTRILIVGEYILSPVLKVEHDVSSMQVYNIEVEEDHSYVAYNCVVHNCNKDITKAKGIILDAFLRPVPFNTKYYKIVLLLAYDRTKDPVLAERILSNQTNAYSVGFYYSSYTCSICGTRVGRGINTRPCIHTQLGRPTYRQSNGKIVYRQCEDSVGFECSSVNTPAFVSAIGPHVYDVRNA